MVRCPDGTEFTVQQLPFNERLKFRLKQKTCADTLIVETTLTELELRVQLEAHGFTRDTCPTELVKIYKSDPDYLHFVYDRVEGCKSLVEYGMKVVGDNFEPVFILKTCFPTAKEDAKLIRTYGCDVEMRDREPVAMIRPDKTSRCVIL